MEMIWKKKTVRYPHISDRSANPLGKLMDFLQEDVDSMQVLLSYNRSLQSIFFYYHDDDLD